MELPKIITGRPEGANQTLARMKRKDIPLTEVQIENSIGYDDPRLNGLAKTQAEHGFRVVRASRNNK